jgi:hypothetical protein
VREASTRLGGVTAAVSRRRFREGGRRADATCGENKFLGTSTGTRGSAALIFRVPADSLVCNAGRGKLARVREPADW